MAWEVKQLGEVLEVLRNGINCKQNKKGNGEKITRIETIAFAKINSDKVGFSLLNEKEKLNYKLNNGDILFSHINSPPHVGKTALFNSNDELYHGVNLLLMRPKNFMLSEYLEYFLKYLYQCGYWKKECKQSVNQASVNQQDIKKVLIKYPNSLPIQKHIVATLDEAFEKLSKAKENAEKNLINAKEVFESYLQSVFENKGKEWEEKALGDICEIIMGQSPDGKTYNTTGDGFPLINCPVEFGKKSFSKTIKSKFTTEPTKVCKENDLILCVRGSTTGRINIAGFDACIGRGVAAIRYSENQAWLNYYILSSRQAIYDLGTGSTFPNVSATILKSLTIPLPQISEQNSIVAKLDSLSQKTKKLESIYNQKLADLEELKQSILQKAFNGELTGVSA